jgi:hypothetical protein
MLPAGSWKAQSRIPYGRSVSSWTTSASPARNRSKVPSRSLVTRTMVAQDDGGVGPLGHHLGDGAALVVGDAGVDGRRVQAGGDRDPAHRALTDVVADLEAEGVAVEGQGGLRVAVREEGVVNGDVHGGHARSGSTTGASRFLTGLVTCFATHDGIPAVACAARRRQVLGGIPISSLKRLLKVPSDEQPTAKQTSVTLRSPRRSSAMARSMRRVIR